MTLSEIKKCSELMLNYAEVRGYISDGIQKHPENFKLQYGQLRALREVCLEDQFPEGQSPFGNCPQLMCANVVVDVGHYFSGDLLSIVSSELSPKGVDLLGRNARVFHRVSQIHIGMSCPIRGTEQQIRNAISRVVEAEAYHCSSWPGSGACSIGGFDVVPVDVVSVLYQGEHLPVLRDLLRRE